jgi:hypothetical protein
MAKRTIKLNGYMAKERAKRLIDEAPANYVATIGEETRTDEQNRKMWPMIKDMREQIEDMGRFTPEQCKLRLLNALGMEMTFLPELDGAGMFPVGQRSSTLTKAQFSLLIEVMLAHGEKHGVQWSAPSREVINENAGRHGVEFSQ